MVKILTTKRALWTILLLLLLPLTALAGDIQVRASRNPVSLSESFSLLFTAKQSPDGEPDFSPLEQDFDILSRNQSSNFQFINGQQSHSITWTLELMPKRSGTLVIPPIAFGKDRSTLASITVQPGVTNPTQNNQPNQAQNGLLLEAEVSTKTPHIQEQTLLTIRFLRAVEIASASMDEPKVTTGDGILEKLGDDQTYETERNGQRYLVTERTYALFPQRSGKLVIDAIPLTAQMPGQGGRSLLQELFKDPMFNNLPLGPSRGRTIKITTKALELDVQPTPAEFAGQPWLPLHRLLLTEKWSPDPPKFQVGEPVTRTITLIGDGLTSAQLPEIPTTPPDGIKHYPDRPVLEDQKETTGIIGHRVEKIAMIPSAPGTYLLPAIKLAWWNTDTHKMKMAQLPQRSITVLPAPGTAPAPLPKPETQANQQPVTQPTSPAALVPPAPIPVATHDGGPWTWISLILACGWLATGILWVRDRRRMTTIAPTQTETTKPLKEIENQLRAACQANDPQAARTALFSHPLHTSSTLEAPIKILNAALFGPLPTPWQGAKLWEAFQATLQENQHKTRTDHPLLPPLYPA